MFNNIKIGKRLFVMIPFMLIGMMVICAYALMNLKENLLVDREIKTRVLVEATESAVTELYNRSQKGEFSEEEARQRAIMMLKDIKYEGSNYIWVNDLKGVFVIHPTATGQDYSGKVDENGKYFMKAFIESAQKGGGFVHYFWKRDQKAPPALKISYVNLFKPWGWVIGTGIYADDVDKVFADNAMAIGGISLVAVFLVSIFVVFVSRGITRPLSKITSSMKKLADGDKTITVEFTSNMDEVGDLARALETFKANAIEMDRMQEEQRLQKQRAEEERKTLMRKMADEFESNVKGVVSTVSAAATELQSNAKSMSSIADQTSKQSTAVAAAAEEASTNVQTVASAAEELNASIGEINRQIGDSVRVAGVCVTEADETSTVMKTLSKSADDIGNVVKLIEDIASQVNLLALNATIEAARAGEAGRGFAVVANEVKNLANQVANAAGTITTQINDIQSQTGHAVETIDSITATIKHISEISTAIAAAVEEQGAATKEISRSIQEAAQGTGEVTRNITNVTRAASETEEASTQVFETSTQLSKEAETLRSVVDNFIATVRGG